VTVKLSREELVRLVTKVMNTEGTEAEIDEYVEAVNRAVPHPAWMDLAFYDERNLTPEQVVEEALAYKPILL
jgi:hypothetical protein